VSWHIAHCNPFEHVQLGNTYDVTGTFPHFGAMKGLFEKIKEISLIP